MRTVRSEPRNRKHYRRLLVFAKDILRLCKKNSLEPIAYGSLAVFFYTQSMKLSVHDIDFLVQESDLSKLLSIMRANNIRYKYLTKYHVLQVFRGASRLEFDSTQFWHSQPPKNTMLFISHGVILRTADVGYLRKIYRTQARTGHHSQAAKKYELLRASA